jgi:hypothetical protein
MSFAQMENKGCVSHIVALLFYINKYLKGKKRRIMETSNISPMPNYDLQKNPLKEAKILQDNITL